MVQAEAVAVRDSVHGVLTTTVCLSFPFIGQEAETSGAPAAAPGHKTSLRKTARASPQTAPLTVMEPLREVGGALLPCTVSVGEASYVPYRTGVPT